MLSDYFRINIYFVFETYLLAPISIDGESVPNEKIHVKVHQALINIYCDGDTIL
jgi:hypothetical protein